MHAASSDALTVSLGSGCGCGCGCSVSSSDWKSSVRCWCSIARTSKLDWSGLFVLSEVCGCLLPFFRYYVPQVVDLAGRVSFLSQLHGLDGIRSCSYLSEKMTNILLIYQTTGCEGKRKLYFLGGRFDRSYIEAEPSPLQGRHPTPMRFTICEPVTDSFSIECQLKGV
jgi:hypothetical protein